MGVGTLKIQSRLQNMHVYSYVNYLDNRSF